MPQTAGFSVGSKLQHMASNAPKEEIDHCSECGRHESRGHDADCNVILAMFGMRVDD